MEELDKVAALENEVEARMLEAMLKERNIPHVVQSFYDDAYDGLFQVTKGWGVVLAPPAYREPVMEALEELRGGPPPPEALDE
jgi:hypothetical protein